MSQAGAAGTEVRERAQRVPTPIGNRRWMRLCFKAAGNGCFKDRFIPLSIQRAQLRARTSAR
jgi:hypothetical protein